MESWYNNTFPKEISDPILNVPLSKARMEDTLVWRGDPIEDFLVRSTYKLLHEGAFNPSYRDQELIEIMANTSTL